MEDDNRLKTGALAWMYEMEVLNSPTLRQNLNENILLSDHRVRDCQILLIQDYKDLMVYVSVGFFSKLFKKREICENVSRVLARILPSYRIRVVTDKNIFNMSLEKVKDFYGGKDEDFNSNPNVPSKSNDHGESELSETSDLLSDQKEQTIDAEESSDESKQCDLQSDKKVQDPS